MASILELLNDDVPSVRVVAIGGVCRVLARLWIILSSEDINRLVKLLIHDLAFDASSPLVRQAVFRGLTKLVSGLLIAYNNDAIDLLILRAGIVLFVLIQNLENMYILR
jgi:hypothetical protein